jgi:hypothetical protein
MKPNKQDIALFNALFELEIKYLVEHARDYKHILLNQILHSDAKQPPDREFMADMASRGFFRSVQQLVDIEYEKQKAYKNIENQIDDILNGE